MSQTRFLKSMITPTLVEPTENHEAGVASGVWSVQDQLEARRGGVWPEAGVSNPDTLIESNFATTLYEGNGSTQSITTGIDSVNKDSLVWIKNRDAADSHILTDTVKGATKILLSDTTAAEATDADTITAFSSTGFALGDDLKVNTNGESYCAWTFKKAPKFFDVVTYTGNDTSGRTIAHSLGTAVGMIAVKNLSRASDWAVFHRSSNSAPQDYVLEFQNANAATSSSNRWNDTAPTSSVFTVGDHVSVNQNGDSYVAYLWAHETGDDSMIQCDSYTGNNNTNGPVIDLGFEPQWLLVKNASGNGSSWSILDSMRGIHTVAPPRLMPDLNNAEFSNADNDVALQANGFKISGTGGTYNDNNKIYVYVAIRRPNMATITDATEVFAMDAFNGRTSGSWFRSDFPVDFAIRSRPNNTDEINTFTRIMANKILRTENTGSEASNDNAQWDHMDGYANAVNNTSFMSWMWKRAKGYFDIVTYTGTGSARTIAHGLGAVPEMMWIKRRNGTGHWFVYSKHAPDLDEGQPAKQQFTRIADNGGGSDAGSNYWNDTDPTATVFSVANTATVNGDGDTFIAYLFATLAGVSKLGSVVHSGSSTDVDCGFSAGSRFVLLKRHDADGDWYVWDSTRGIIAGNDPYFLLNSTAAQVTNTDLIDPLASGFQISGDFTDGTYLFYAIA